MQKQHRSSNWLVILMCAILAALSFWSIRILVTNTRGDSNETEYAKSIVNDQTLVSKQQTLLIGGDDSNPPYSYIQDGEALGLDNDLMREVAKNLGMKAVFNLSTLAEARQNLIDGKVDVIGGISFSQHQDENLLFGTSHAVQYYDLFVRQDSGISSISSMKDKITVVIAGDEIINFLTQQGITGQVVTAETPVDALTWLASGKYDGVVINKIQGYYLINKYNISNLKSVGDVLNELDYGFAVAKGNRNLLFKINQSMAIINASGIYDELNNKWLSAYQKASFFDKNQYIIYGLVVFFTAIFIVVAWGWSLRRLVKRRTAELKASEKKYKQLIGSATEGVVILVERKIVFLNLHAARIFGFEDNIPEGHFELFDYIHPLDHELVMIKYQQIMDDLPANVLISFRINTINKQLRWIKANSAKIEWEGKPAILAFFSDVTEERKMQESIKTSEERYRLVFAQSPVGLFHYDSELIITNVNHRFAEIFGGTLSDLEGYDLHKLKEERIIDALKIVNQNGNGFYEGRITPIFSKAQKSVYVKMQTAPLHNEKYEIQGGIGLIEDLTAQITIEHKIQNLEDRFAKAFFTSPDAIIVNELKTGRFIDINRGFTELTGYTRDEIIGKSSLDIDLWVHREDRHKLVDGLIANGEYKNLEAEFRYKDGQIRVGLLSASVIEVDGVPCVLSITRDIDDIKKSEQLIRESEIRYRSIFDSVSVAIWEEDLLEVYDMLEELRQSGITDLSEYMNNHHEFLIKAVQSIKILDVNDASLKMYKADSKEQLLFTLDRIFNDESVEIFKSELLSIWNHDPYFNGDTVNLDLDGNRMIVNLLLRLPAEREKYRNVLVSMTDITQRKLAEAALLESELRYRQLVEQINVVVYLDYVELPSRTKYISPQIESLLGYSQDEWLADPDLLIKVIHPDDRQFVLDEDNRTDASREPFVVEYRAFTRDGQMLWIHEEATLVYDAQGKPEDWHGVMYDITARKMAEEALRDSENRYRSIFNTVPVAIKEEDFSTIYAMMEELRQAGVEDFEEYLAKHPEWAKKAVESVKIIEVNQETLRIYKAESKEQLLNSLDQYFSTESYNVFQRELVAFWNRQSSYEHETVNVTITGELINVWISIAIPDNPENYNRILVTIMDITERKRAEEQIRVQVRYLAALRAVDMAISASMDLPITLRVLLNQVHQQLMAQAVSILILDQHTQTLRYAAGIGFKTNAIESTNLRLGQSGAGQAALERRIVTIENLDVKGAWTPTKDFELEEFTSYMGIPLVSKGTVKGVLELFGRKPFVQDSAWMGLLESMAGQAAIAIENATLMDEVQKVNVNLRSAYDATIEGWARSIDLRSGDSELHAKRVAELTIELAQVVGVQGEGLLALRRGALLHDIGKLGVPDAILLKNGPLTEEEWVIMKTHPAVAKRLLTSIDFLQSVVEIPYYHHEHWDGSGYPEGLAGNDIPLSARVFAIVDCWDSLRSDRPWRKAWTDGNAWDYIEKNSGVLFDPQIVEKFRQLIGHGFSAYY
jgi:PAS domain S-box-containing protein/putative nucleotidyltransferase with HDIG domain